jgi:formylglycine-generating enzyme required for sulfatase activity
MVARVFVGCVVSLMLIVSDSAQIIDATKDKWELPSDMPTEHQELVKEQYNTFLKTRAKEKAATEEAKKQSYQKPPEGKSPKKLGMKRDDGASLKPLTSQVEIQGGRFWFGTQVAAASTTIPTLGNDGALPRRAARVTSFFLDTDVVNNAQFNEFVKATGYQTEAELFGWSFVLDSLLSADMIAEVDSEKGYGRVKEAPHWCAVNGASWKKPFGADSPSLEKLAEFPVVHISFKDAEEYCAWSRRRLPTEHEWEYAARGSLLNQSYPWGDAFEPSRMNAWDGKFPKENTLVDGFHGLAPVHSYKPQNNFGVYNMLGNVWEWVDTRGGKKKKLSTAAEGTLRGGSFVDSLDGSFNHIVLVSTRQTNAVDSGANNIGFRCAKASSLPSTGNEKSEL